VAGVAYRTLRRHLEASGTVVVPPLAGGGYDTGVQWISAGDDGEKRVLEEGIRLSVDAIVLVRLDALSVRDRLYREVSVRLSAEVFRPRDGTKAGPYSSFSALRTAPRIIAKGFVRRDEQLAEEVAENAARELYVMLDRGTQEAEAAERRAAVLPACVPPVAVLRRGRAAVLEALAVPMLGRNADILLQLEMEPSCAIVAFTHIAKAMRELGLSIEDLWHGDTPDIYKAAVIGRRLRTDVVLLSRVVSATVEAMPTPDDREETFRAEVTVRCAAIRISDGTYLWDATRSGSASTTIRHLTTTIHARRADQAVWDATINAYGQIRAAWEEFLKQRRKRQ